MLGELTGGTRLTIDCCQKAGKPYLVNPAADELRNGLRMYRIGVLNAAGNRGSNPSAEQITYYRQLLHRVLE